MYNFLDYIQHCIPPKLLKYTLLETDIIFTVILYKIYSN